MIVQAARENQQNRFNPSIPQPPPKKASIMSVGFASTDDDNTR